MYRPSNGGSLPILRIRVSKWADYGCHHGSSFAHLENHKKSRLTVSVTIGCVELGEFELDVFVETKD